MDTPKSDSEILEFAIAREIEANRFYLALADRVAGEDMRKIFEELAEEEIGHKRKLELEMMKTGRIVTNDKPEIPEHDYVVSDTDAPLDMDYKDMLLLGIEKEDAAFRTYINLLSSVNDQESREVLLALAQEEVKHKLRFETEYDFLMKKS